MSTFEQRSARALWSATWPLVDRKDAPVDEFVPAVAGLRRTVARIRQEAVERERVGDHMPLTVQSLSDLDRELQQCMSAGRTSGWAGRIALAYRAACSSLELTARTNGPQKGDVR